MKNTITALVLLSLVIGYTVFHGRYSNDCTDRLLSLTASLENSDKETRKDILSNCLSIWQKKRRLLSMGIPKKDLREIDKCLSDLFAFSEGKDDEKNGDFLAAVYALRQSLTDIKNDERLSLDNIL